VHTARQCGKLFVCVNFLNSQSTHGDQASSHRKKQHSSETLCNLLRAAEFKVAEPGIPRYANFTTSYRLEGSGRYLPQLWICHSLYLIFQLLLFCLGKLLLLLQLISS
jgi:hypothetical protein